MPTARTKKSNAVYLWVGTAVLLVIVFYAVRMATRSSIPIRAATAQRGDLRSVISSNGKVEPQRNFEAHAPFPGLIKAIYVHEGEKVSQGKLLLQMDDTNARAQLATALAALRGAQASYDAMTNGGTQEERLSLGGQLTTAEINLDQAKRDLAALQKLQLTGAASASEVAAARERLKDDNSQLQVLQKRKVSRYGTAEVAHVKAALNDAKAGYAAAQQAVNQANVRAPFAGTVYSLPVSATEYVQQGDKLLQLADLTKLQVRAYFDEPEIGHLKVGLPVSIKWDAKPDRLWHGHISRVPSTIITYGTRNVGEVLVTIDDPDNILLPDTNVTVTVLYANERNVLSVPREALHSEQGKSFVYRVENGTLHRTAIQVGNINLTQVQVLSGLKAGDVVALGSTNGQPVGDGMAVKVVQ